MNGCRAKALALAAVLALALALPTAAYAVGLSGFDPIASASPAVTAATGAEGTGEQVPPGTDVDTTGTQSPGSGLPAGTPPPGSAAAKPVLIGLMVILVAAVVLLGASLMKKGGKKE